MDLQLTDRVVLVVGGTGLIGSAVADALRAEGAVPVLAARGDDTDIVLDATDDASVAAGVAAVLAQHGRIDGLVVTAAPAAQTLDPARANEPSQVAEQMERKGMAFLRVANAVLPSMREAGAGRIVGVAGQLARMSGSITAAVRNASLIIAAKALADETAGTGITVNVVNPGAVVPEPGSDIRPAAPGDSTPAQVASLIVYLLSPVHAVSGESIAVGHSLRGVVSI